MTRIAIATALVLGLSGSALAQEADEAGTDAGQLRTEHTFTDADLIEGSTPGASGIRLESWKAPWQGSLIEPRTTFAPEMVESVQDL